MMVVSGEVRVGYLSTYPDASPVGIAPSSLNKIRNASSGTAFHRDHTLYGKTSLNPNGMVEVCQPKLLLQVGRTAPCSCENGKLLFSPLHLSDNKEG